MSEDLVVEATGETVGEAKWAALRELEKLRPGIDKAAVEFEVVTEGERGLLGVGYAPARVVARIADLPDVPREEIDESALASDVRSLLELICFELGVRARIDVVEDEDGLFVSASGGDLGVLIGREGRTIDAVQYVLNAVVNRGGGERVDVTVDAAGYRERRRAILEQLAVRVANEAIDTGRPVELEPMTAVERKVVHLRLQNIAGVETSSEGVEPNRYVVVSPV